MSASRISPPRTHGTEAPPGITAFKFFHPPRIPPQCLSISSSNGLEDHVSMGANGANQLRDIIDNLYQILAVLQLLLF